MKVTDEMVERACKKYHEAWGSWPEALRGPHREWMREALEAALEGVE